ncbi:hypothetical protein [Tateyamaria sp. syn59]|uniref:hypothetical protein n=1 Tax=Tateyamaria sp. syn59 TaxID=2576942 RepID=UPI0011BDC86E|nr:hypothetical protein [Tateyamaria sp. syn59]
MTIITQLPSGGDFRSLFEHHTVGSGFFLTVDDRAGIEHLLRYSKTRNASNPALLNGLLRHKLRISRGAIEPASPELVVTGRQITYLIREEGSRSGVLSMGPTPIPGHFLVTSLLGATLIGMRKLQKAPLLRDDGQIDKVVVLDVDPSTTHHTA